MLFLSHAHFAHAGITNPHRICASTSNSYRVGGAIHRDGSKRGGATLELLKVLFLKRDAFKKDPVLKGFSRWWALLGGYLASPR